MDSFWAVLFGDLLFLLLPPPDPAVVAGEEDMVLTYPDPGDGEGRSMPLSMRLSCWMGIIRREAASRPDAELP